MPPGVQDRTVRITGADLEQLMRATALILTKLSQNPNYSRFTSTSVSYGGYSAGYGGTYGGRNAAPGPPPEVRPSRRRCQCRTVRMLDSVGTYGGRQTVAGPPPGVPDLGAAGRCVVGRGHSRVSQRRSVYDGDGALGAGV